MPGSPSMSSGRPRRRASQVIGGEGVVGEVAGLAERVGQVVRRAERRPRVHGASIPDDVPIRKRTFTGRPRPSSQAVSPATRTPECIAVDDRSSDAVTQRPRTCGRAVRAGRSEQGDDCRGQLAEGEAADQAGDDHGQAPVGEHREGRLVGVRAGEPAGPQRLDEHPRRPGSPRSPSAATTAGPSVSRVSRPMVSDPTSRASPVRRHASAVRSCGAVGSDAGGDDPASGRSATGEARDAQHDRGHRDGRPARRASRGCWAACAPRASPARCGPSRATAAPAVSSPASASAPASRFCTTSGSGSGRASMAAAPATRASAVRIQARKVRSLASEKRGSGSVPVGVDAARPAVLGVGHAGHHPRLQVVEVAGRVEVAPGGEVAALDEVVRGGAQVVAGAPVAARRGDDGRPVVAADGHRVARDAVVGRPREGRAPVGPARGQDALGPPRRVTSGRSTRVTSARSSSPALEVGQPGPQRGAHPLVPVVGVHDLDARAPTSAATSSPAAPTTTTTRSQPARGHPGHGGLDEGRATVGEPHEGLRAAHPAAGPGGEHEPHGGHGASLPRGPRRSGWRRPRSGGWVFG